MRTHWIPLFGLALVVMGAVLDPTLLGYGFGMVTTWWLCQ